MKIGELETDEKYSSHNLGSIFAHLPTVTEWNNEY
jgi:hypothetical protein